MARLPDIRRLVPDQLPGPVREWVLRGLVDPINRLLEPVFAALDHNLSPADNLNGQYLEVTLVVPTSWTDKPQDFTSKLRGRCRGIIVVGAVELDGSGKPSGNNHGVMGAPDWEEVLPTDNRGATLRIRNQTGLTAGQKYRVTWYAMGE